MSDISSIIDSGTLEQYERTAHRLEVAACMLYVWDFVLTFHHEVDVLWGTKWSTSRVLFFINRYLTLAAIIVSTCLDFQTNLVQSKCHILTNLGYIGLPVAANIQIILLRRLFVVYEYSRVVVVSIVALGIVSIGATLGFDIALSVYSKTHESMFEGVCKLQIPTWFKPFWVPLMAFDFVVGVLVGFKAVQRYRRIPNKSWFSARFMKVLARDSFIYFALIFLNYLLILWVMLLTPSEFMTLGASWTLVIPPIMANHLLINMESSHFQNGGSVGTDTCLSIRKGDSVTVHV